MWHLGDRKEQVAERKCPIIPVISAAWDSFTTSCAQGQLRAQSGSMGSIDMMGPHARSPCVARAESRQPWFMSFCASFKKEQNCSIEVVEVCHNTSVMTIA